MRGGFCASVPGRHERKGERKMWIRRVVTIGAALVWGVTGGGPVRAGDGIKPVDRCQTLEVGDRSTFVVVKNLFAPGGDCLIINSSDVTLDLSGFTISGAGTGKGITSSASVHNVTVRNGTVRGFAVGVSLGGHGNVVEEVRIVDHSDTGLFLGAGGLARNLVIQGNFHVGALLSTACALATSVVRANGNSAQSSGISAGPGSTITGNTIWANIGTGLSASSGSTIMGNTVLDTTGVGMLVTCPANVVHNSATANSGGNLLLNGEGCNTVQNVAP